MSVIHIDLPESVLLTTGQSQEDFVKEAKFLLALKLFELGRMSSGVAAEISGMPRVDFLLRAGQAMVPVADLDEEELVREFVDE
jgi:predicted HTH domain antitoxin